MLNAQARSVRCDDFKFRTTNVNDPPAAQCQGWQAGMSILSGMRLFALYVRRGAAKRDFISS